MKVNIHFLSPSSPLQVSQLISATSRASWGLRDELPHKEPPHLEATGRCPCASSPGPSAPTTWSPATRSGLMPRCPESSKRTAQGQTALPRVRPGPPQLGSSGLVLPARPPALRADAGPSAGAESPQTQASPENMSIPPGRPGQLTPLATRPLPLVSPPGRSCWGHGCTLPPPEHSVLSCRTAGACPETGPAGL